MIAQSRVSEYATLALRLSPTAPHTTVLKLRVCCDIQNYITTQKEAANKEHTVASSFVRNVRRVVVRVQRGHFNWRVVCLAGKGVNHTNTASVLLWT